MRTSADGNHKGWNVSSSSVWRFVLNTKPLLHAEKKHTLADNLRYIGRSTQGAHMLWLQQSTKCDQAKTAAARRIEKQKYKSAEVAVCSPLQNKESRKMEKNRISMFPETEGENKNRITLNRLKYLMNSFQTQNTDTNWMKSQMAQRKNVVPSLWTAAIRLPFQSTNRSGYEAMPRVFAFKLCIWWCDSSLLMPMSVFAVFCLRLMKMKCTKFYLDSEITFMACDSETTKSFIQEIPFWD